MQTDWRTPAKPRSALDKTARIQVHFPEKSRTQQHQKDDCDINKIIERFKRGIPITHLRKGTPEYGDFTNAMDYLEAANAITRAASSFAELPQEIRDRFPEPADLLEFIEDDANRDEAEKLGLVPQSKTVPSTEPAAAEEAATIPLLDGNGTTDTEQKTVSKQEHTNAT